MNFRSLIRRQADSVPLLPVSEPEDTRITRAPRKSSRADLEERLERLLTPTELDIVLHHRPSRS